MYGQKSTKLITNVLVIIAMVGNSKIFLFTGLIAIMTLLVITVLYPKNQDLELIYAQNLKDPNLHLSPEYSGFTSPTGLAFLDASGKNILVIEKKGDVKLISDGVLQETPVKHFDVDFQSERGLLGIEVMKESNSTHVFLYMTINDPEFSGDNTGETLRNRVYSFEWDGKSLVDQKLLLDLPATPGPNHNGGKITLGKDNSLYAIIGDLNHRTKLQNFEAGDAPDFTGSIYRIDPRTGEAPPDNPFVNSNIPNMEKTFAYGIRNSFGLTVDPITGTIWDTENGPSFSDEINIVAPGFNSGWRSIMGPSTSADEIEGLVYLAQNSNYSEPEISWTEPPALTDIEFINSNNLGGDYANNLLVGDYNNGNLYFLKLNDDRSGLDVQDSVIDTENENDNLVLGTGFGSITDIETGPDGNVYVVSLETGTIYKIT